MLRGKATLPLWFEPSHDYVGPAVTEIIYGPVGLIGAVFSAVGLFLGRKSKISHEQNVKEFQFYIRMPNFRLLGSIIKKKYLKVADPLNGSPKHSVSTAFLMSVSLWTSTLFAVATSLVSNHLAHRVMRETYPWIEDAQNLPTNIYLPRPIYFLLNIF